MVNSFGPITHHIKETLRLIKSMDLEHTPGLMIDNIPVNGKIIKWTVKESIDGKMAVYMWVTIIMIRNMDLEHFHSLMVEFMKAHGLMVNKTELENTEILTVT